jgi:hypothetical protein
MRGWVLVLTCRATFTSDAEASWFRSTVMAPRKPKANVPAAWGLM